MNTTEQKENVITVIVDGNEESFPMEHFGLQFSSTEHEIWEAMEKPIREQYGVEIRDDYKIKKMINSRNIYIFPHSTAG